MASKKLIILSLFAVVSSLFAETAADYVHRGAQKYIFGQEEAAEAEVATGLAKFPNDPELQELAGLVHKKKPPPQNQQQQQQQQQNQQQQQQQNQQQQQKDQQQQQQQQGQGEQQQKDQQQSQDQQSQGKSENQKDQQEKNNQLQAKNQPQKNQQQQPGETPSPSPGAEKQQGPQPSPSPGERQGEESPSPGEGGENETPSPSPGEGENENATPSATPGESPQKKFAGEVKGAGDDKSQKPPDKNAQVAEAEPEKEGQMSERQAEALLESMKDEEARVQLDERRATRHALGETVHLEIRVTGARGADAPEAIMVDGLEIRRTGTSQRIEMNNLSLTSSVIYDYTVMPLRAGRFTIPPQTIRARHTRSQCK